MVPVLVLSLGLAAAVVTDVRTRRIPNWLTAAMAGAGFGLAFGGGVVTPAQAALGLLAGLLLMMPGHVIGATGAGDVKLMAAVGAIVGPDLALPRVSLSRRSPAASSRSRSPLRRGILADNAAGRRPPRDRAGGRAPRSKSPARANRFAYGPAIAVGTLVSVMVTS